MVNWEKFAQLRPDMASAGQQLLDEHRLAYLATSRKDGSPRLHPVTPVRTATGLYVAVNHRSPKRWDLDRDGRYALHAPIGESDEEFVITGHSVRIADSNVRAEVVSSAGHVIHDTDWLFEFRIDQCLHGHWVNAGQPGTYPVRQIWNADDEG